MDNETNSYTARVHQNSSGGFAQISDDGKKLSLMPSLWRQVGKFTIYIVLDDSNQVNIYKIEITVVNKPPYFKNGNLKT